jgi:predicted DCC family thiol-disulfide oxidoreductase YuxK
MDGACGLCRRSRAWCERHDQDGGIRFVDFRAEDEKELPLSHEDHRKSMWVRDRDGGLVEGFAAWRRIMTEMPGWRWLAGLTSLPPFNLIGPPLYRFVAANRRFLSDR